MYNSSSPCENSWYLRENQYNDDLIHQRWLDTLPEKIDSIKEYSVSILEGFVCQTEFEWSFNSFLNNDTSCERLYIVLDDWNAGEVADEDEEFLREIALAALESSASVLFDEEFIDICTEGNFNVARLISEVLE